MKKEGVCFENEQPWGMILSDLYFPNAESAVNQCLDVVISDKIQ